MPRIQFPDGSVEVPPGTSILDAALDHGIELPHECGGVCNCASCHVRVVEGMENLTALDEVEEERLAGVAGRKPDSRLACQSRAWGDVVVVIPKETEMDEQKTSPLSKDRVEEVLNRIREWIAADGGYVELVNINEDDGVVFIRFQGACAG